MNSRKCDVCNIDVYRASYAQLLRSKKHLEKEKQNEMIIPEWLFKEPIENKVKNMYNPKPIKQKARDNIKLDDKHFSKEIAKKMINPYNFTDRNLKLGFKINLDCHYINHASSKLTITHCYPEFGNEVPIINKITKELSFIYARLLNHYKFKYQTIFSARFDKQDEDNQVLDETELYNNLTINHNLTQTDIDKVDVKSPLENQKQQQEMNDSG